jgi:hypothetical protein
MAISPGWKGRRFAIPAVIMSVLFFGVLACAFDFNTSLKTPNETEISKSVEDTLTAEQTLSANPQEITQTSVSSSTAPSQPGIAETIQAQQATLDAQATLLAQASPTIIQVQESPSATLPEPSSTEPVSLLDWDATNMSQAPGCGEDRNGPPCWFGTGTELTMLSAKPILIDPSWPKPYLVFSHRYDFIQNATIYINVDGEWKVLWSFFQGQSSLWLPFQVDLSDYKGKEILFQFTELGSTNKKSMWNIRDPQIIPNYTR